MKVAATFTAAGVSTRIETRPIDIVRWEKSTKQKITNGLGGSDLMQLIHLAGRREGLIDIGFEEWAAQLDDFEPEAPGSGPTSTPPGV